MPADPQSRVMRHQAYQTAFLQWFATLPLEEQERLRALKLDKPESEQFGPVRSEEDEHERPEQGEWSHPVENIESSPEAEDELAKAFGGALAWCCQGRDVVEVGRRLIVVLHIWRPALVAGLTLEHERELIASFREDVDDGNGPDGVSARVGEEFGPMLEWPRRATTMSQVGQRVLAMAYVIRPTFIGGKTLAEIGESVGNKTRQAIDKLVQDFRDTFGGIKSRNMRDEAHRITCHHAQLLNPP